MKKLGRLTQLSSSAAETGPMHAPWVACGMKEGKKEGRKEKRKKGRKEGRKKERKKAVLCSSLNPT